MATARIFVPHRGPCCSSILQKSGDIGPVYKTNLVQTKSLSDHGPDQIWLCKQYQKFGPKQDLLMCKDHGPIKFGPVFGYVNAPCSSDQTKSLTFGEKVRVATKMANCQCGANWSNDETWIIIRIWSLY